MFAAIDLGTNNCRLLIARPAGDAMQVVDAFSRVVRLGEGLEATGLLGETAIARTISALHICRSKIARAGVTAMRAVATEACRRATNADAFVTMAEAATGIRLEVISSAEEARLAFSGCAALLEPCDGYALVFDIGGGSTEFTWLALEGGRPRPIDHLSVPEGVVGLTERFGGDRVSEEDFEAMKRRVLDGLLGFEARHAIARRIAAGEVQGMGASGTVTTLAGIQHGLTRYERSRVDGCYLDIPEALAEGRRLLLLDRAERAAVPCVGRARAELVLAGCAILEAICTLWPVPRLRIADRGLREGMLLDLAGVSPCR